MRRDLFAGSSEFVVILLATKQGWLAPMGSSPAKAEKG